MQADVLLQAPRKTGVFATPRNQRRYTLTVGLLVAAAVLVSALILTWGNQFDFLSDKWWKVTSMRTSALLVIALVTFCQAFATVAFQTVTGNRLITPSLMGFDALFVLTQTGIVYFLGTAGLEGMSAGLRFALQVVLMVGFAVFLYTWLLSGRLGNLHVMLLVGIVLGTGLGALSTFMQRMLDPNEFDVLRARLFANIGNADTTLLPAVLPICLVAGTALWLLSPRLNVMSLGRDAANNLGVNHKRTTMLVLTLVAVLVAMSTSLVGPMVFLGFLAATLTYSMAETYDHRRVMPLAWLAAFVVLGGAYFLLKQVLPMVDAVMIVVELVGGLVFLIVILKRGRL